MKLFASFLRMLLIITTSLVYGCQIGSSAGIFEQDRYAEWRNYERDVGSRIEQFLEIAEQELVANFEKKEYLMLRGGQPAEVIHPRKDRSLRELIHLAYEDEAISAEQRNDYENRCDELYELWEQQWNLARRKARRMGFDD